ncbi:hypothetical protein PILCRDRAFT_384105 [Piloderma croceum F 1598]|uniref:Uncharacterized protein n=1 Tax=Piloderma croceum (strain F 1598) TaxID=765440 RepID=A0A0C3BDR3_PILCF|nr:hypothetical protein PILCRDRAFT_384105 [Piloderma croceum F 1598]
MLRLNQMVPSAVVTDGKVIHSLMVFLTKRVFSRHKLSQSRQGRPDYLPVFVYLAGIIISYHCRRLRGEVKVSPKCPSFWWPNERIRSQNYLLAIPNGVILSHYGDLVV